jgi:hypothetical protein
MKRDTQRNETQHNFILLFMLSFIIQNVIMLSVVMLNVMAPLYG